MEEAGDDEQMLASLKFVQTPFGSERQLPADHAESEVPAESQSVEAQTAAAPVASTADIADDAAVETVMAEFANPENQAAIQIEERKS